MPNLSSIQAHYSYDRKKIAGMHEKNTIVYKRNPLISPQNETKKEPIPNVIYRTLISSIKFVQNIQFHK